MNLVKRKYNTLQIALLIIVTIIIQNLAKFVIVMVTPIISVGLPIYHTSLNKVF